MKSENELDDFLRSKEEGFNIPFEEKYWDKASAFIDAERGRRAAGWNIRNMILIVGVITLLMGGVSYLLLSTTSSNKTEIANSTTINSSNTNTTANNNTSVTNSTSAAAATVNSTTANTATTNAANTNITNTNEAKSGNANTSVSSKAHNVNSSTITSTSKKFAKLTAKTSKSISGSNSTVVNNSDNNSTTESGRTATNNVKVQPNIPSLTDLTSPKIMYFNYPVESTIPVFANMSVYDNAMSSLYGLPFLKSDGSAAAKKIREFKYGTQYPQLGIALTGGINIFNSFKDEGHNYSYLSVNPFLGVKGSYQWNEKWFVQAQLNLLQRGGVNEDVPAGDLKEGLINPASQVYEVRNLYYVQLPVMMGYQISKKNSITAGLGINYLLADGAQARDTSSGKYAGSYKIENDKGFNRLDYFVTAGYTYRMNRRFSVTLTASYGLTNVTDNSYFDQTGSRHDLNLGLALNYSLLQKKIFAR